MYNIPLMATGDIWLPATRGGIVSLCLLSSREVRTRTYPVVELRHVLVRDGTTNVVSAMPALGCSEIWMKTKPVRHFLAPALLHISQCTFEKIRQTHRTQEVDIDGIFPPSCWLTMQFSSYYLCNNTLLKNPHICPSSRKLGTKRVLVKTVAALRQDFLPFFLSVSRASRVNFGTEKVTVKGAHPAPWTPVASCTKTLR